MEYVLVLWPEVQQYMDEPWFRNEACLYTAPFESEDHHDSAYFIPKERISK